MRPEIVFHWSPTVMRQQSVDVDKVVLLCVAASEVHALLNLTRVLTDLYREIHESDNDRDSADEISEIS
jgi:hypothetical protein